MKPIVVVSCTTPAGLLPMYAEQVKSSDIEFRCNKLGKTLTGNVGNLGESLEIIRRALSGIDESTKVVVTDAWDVLFYGTAEELESKIPDEGVLWAAERNCWPDEYLWDNFPSTGTPWKYANGGMVCGTAGSILEWCEKAEKHPSYSPFLINQQWLNWLLLAGDPLVKIDSGTNVFYCMNKEKGELVFQHGRPFNNVLKVTPNFIHFNGKHDPSNFFLMQAIHNGIRVQIQGG